MPEEVLAKWWEPTDKNKTRCTLCPRYCHIGPGQTGFCFIRKNLAGKLYTCGYGHPTGFGIDPIEKKPLYHFLPGSSILSFGTAGCNLGCKFCQNWSMSKAKLDNLNSLSISAKGVVELALHHKTPSIAYTYNDPTIFGEYVIDISNIARDFGIKSVMVTSGYIDSVAREEVYRYIDAANVDLKSFSDNFYYKFTYAHLSDILDTLVWIKNETKVWLEITTLLIPGANDSESELHAMCKWIINNLGDSVPLHFTAFHPDFKMTNYEATPPSSLRRARSIALDTGIQYCYLGNIADEEGQTSICPNCQSKLIERSWHTLKYSNIRDGKCTTCGHQIAGVFK